MNRRAFLSLFATTPALFAAPPLTARTPSTGLIFVGASWCPVCHQAAPMLAAFSQAHGVPVIVASEDARPIPPFPDVVPAAGHPIAATVEAFPTTFVYSSAADQVVAAILGFNNATWYLGEVRRAVLHAEQL